jgi:hypothetical protein
MGEQPYYSDDGLNVWGPGLHRHGESFGDDAAAAVKLANCAYSNGAASVKSKTSPSQIIRAARKRLSLIGDKQLNANLELAADNMADAYRIGAEEAQLTILSRLQRLFDSPSPQAAVGNSTGEKS